MQDTKLPFLKSFFFVVLFLVVQWSVSPCFASDEKPNILWIIAEDMGPELGCYGTPEVHTPILDRMADQGVRYRNAFTVTPVCSTSRSSLMTGMVAMSINAHHHRSHRDGTNPLPSGVQLVTDWLRPAGYTTANLERLTDDFPDSQFFKGTGKTDWNFSLPAGHRPFDLDRWDDLKDHQPFFAQVNFSESHRGKDWNQAHEHIEKIADPDKVELPPYYPDHPVTRAVWAQYLNNVMAVDKKVGFLLDRLKRDGLEKNTIVIFLSDHGRAMPRGKQWPYDSGLHIPLIVYWPEGSKSFPEPSNYVRGAVNDQLISSIDITATTLSLAGVDKPPQMQGRIFLGEKSESSREYVFSGRDRGDETVFHIRTVRDKRYRYLRNKYPNRPFLQINRYKERAYPIIGLLRHLDATGQLTGPPAALTAKQRPSEELYDLQTDPWEIRNLAESPKHAQVKHRLSEALDQWIEDIDDKGRVEEDPAIVRVWEQKMQENFDEHLRTRPADWYRTDEALGPYRKNLSK